MTIVADITLLAASGRLPPRRRAPLANAGALLELSLRGRLEFGGDRVLVRRPQPVGDPATNLLLDAITSRRRPPTVDRCLGLRARDVLEVADAGGGDSLDGIRKRVDQALQDRALGFSDMDPAIRALAGLAVAVGLASFPARKGRAGRGPEAALVVVGDLPMLVKATVTAVAARVGTAGASPVELLRLPHDRDGRRRSEPAG